MTFPKLSSCTVAVIGLGYVGLPLAVELAKNHNCYKTDKELSRKVLGFDINQKRLEEINEGFDKTNEISSELLKQVNLEVSKDPSKLIKADVFIITVPTPIDNANRPNLSPLEKATKLVALAIKERSKNNPSSIPIIIYESTVYPGATEEVCIPILESSSELKYNNMNPSKGFACGYSPERINPGDKEHNLTNIIKVTSGSTKEISQWVDDFYGSIIKIGTHQAGSLKIAEAAKVIENTQRDINIALVNELAIIFKKIGIDTRDVLEAAGSKWNFLKFYPGLVGGHCIGVDPYYLTYKSEQLDYYPEIVLAGRRINNSMGSWIVEQLVLEMAKKKIIIGGANVLVLGFTFKENCPDLRNTRVMCIVDSLKNYGIQPEVIDPLINREEAQELYKINILDNIPANKKYTAVICAVAHNEFKLFSKDQWLEYIQPEGIFFDLKDIIPRELNPIRL